MERQNFKKQIDESKFDVYLQSLPPEVNVKHDYDILFPPLDKANDKLVVDTNRLDKLFAEFRLEEFSTAQNDRAEEILMKDSPPFVPPELMNQQDDAQIAKWCLLLESASLTEVDLLGISIVPDHEFDQIFMCTQEIDLKIVDTLVRYFTSNFTSNVKRVSASKINTLASHALLPKMLKGDLPLRAVLPIFQKFVAMDQDAAIHKILLPMFQRKVVIARPLLVGVNKKVLLESALIWLQEESIPLTTYATTCLNLLLEGQKKLEDDCGEILIKIIGQSFLQKPGDKSIAFFFLSFVANFGPTLTPRLWDEIKITNEYNQTDTKMSINQQIEKYSVL